MEHTQVWALGAAVLHQRYCSPRCRVSTSIVSCCRAAREEYPWQPLFHVMFDTSDIKNKLLINDSPPNIFLETSHPILRGIKTVSSLFQSIIIIIIIIYEA